MEGTGAAFLSCVQYGQTKLLKLLVRREEARARGGEEAVADDVLDVNSRAGWGSSALDVRRKLGE